MLKWASMLRKAPRRSAGTTGRFWFALVVGLALAGLTVAWLRTQPGPGATPPAPAPAPDRIAAPPSTPPIAAPGPARPSDAAGSPQPKTRWDELQAPGFCPADGRIHLPTVDSLLRVASADPSAPEAVAEASREVAAGDEQAAREHLRAARDSLGDHPEAALAFALLQAHQPDQDMAIEALDDYLVHRPDDLAIRQLHARLSLQAELQRDHVLLSDDGINLLVPPDFTRAEADGLLALLGDALQEAAELTATRRRDALTVVVYQDRSELLAASCVRTWAAGLYDGTIRLTADARLHPRVWRQRVRHEVLHAQLAARAPGTPKWFNEGLAQCFAGQFSAGHVRTYERMLANQTWIPFTSLVGSFGDFGDPEDASMAYHQSLAMVQMMVDREGRAAIGRALAQPGDAGSDAALLEVMFPDGLDGQDLLAFLAAWREANWVPRVRCGLD